MSRLRMPSHLIERAQALVGAGADTVWSPPPLRDAATVVLVADDPSGGLQVYLQRRVRTMAFAAGMYVFPGGAVDEIDLDNADRWMIDNAEALNAMRLVAQIQRGEDAIAARYAAMRETLEEADFKIDDPTKLAYIAHWVTPEVEDRRFDTRFYAVAVGPDHAHIHRNTESDKEVWLSPAEALAQYGAGEMLMLPPTVAVVSAFAEQAEKGRSADKAIEELSARPVQPLLPSPAADPDDPSGIRWRLVDVRTGDEITQIAQAPAGSEAGGVEASLTQDNQQP